MKKLFVIAIIAATVTLVASTHAFAAPTNPLYQLSSSQVLIVITDEGP